MIYLIIYAVLGFISLGVVWMDGFGWADVSIGSDRPLYVNILSFFILVFGYSFMLLLAVISLPITLPLGTIAFFMSGKEKRLEAEKKIADKKKHDEWLRAPR